MIWMWIYWQCKMRAQIGGCIMSERWVASKQRQSWLSFLENNVCSLPSFDVMITLLIKTNRVKRRELKVFWLNNNNNKDQYLLPFLSDKSLKLSDVAKHGYQLNSTIHYQRLNKTEIYIKDNLAWYKLLLRMLAILLLP